MKTQFSLANLNFFFCRTFKNGIQVTLPAFFNSPKNFKWETNQDFERNLKILDGLPKMIRQIQTLLEEGIKEEMTFAKVSIQGTIDKLKGLQKDFSDPPFFSQFARNILYRKMALQIIEKKILLTKTRLSRTDNHTVSEGKNLLDFFSTTSLQGQ